MRHAPGPYLKVVHVGEWPASSEARCTYLEHCSGAPITWLLIQYEDGSMYAGEACGTCATAALEYLSDLSEGGCYPKYLAWRRLSVPLADEPHDGGN